ncbi:hypothetical protein LTR62_007465 [Meristemomyces frigidus]|uniref:MARVEL domain-containing protein n=1 Tax=Meristemomyces frigidus TaxID=1508187 RepID=A0AAN7TH69_9PEZI|nr:hypothetical protein LTR62_007465 [Meristemomyces frigidus]
MRIAQDRLQNLKVGVHCAQACAIFIVACLTLGVLTKDGGSGSMIGFQFGLCFLSIPALIYQIMVPMWSRAWRFANVYAYTSIDLVFFILWFAAFVGVAHWNSSGGKGDSAQGHPVTTSTGACGHFAWGSMAKCQVSEATVGFGVIITLLFAATTVISIMGILRHNQDGGVAQGRSRRVPMDETTKDVWNTNTDELDSSRLSDDNPFDERHAYGQISQTDLAARNTSPDNGKLSTSHSLHRFVTSDSAHPGRPISYGSSTNLSITPAIYVENEAPSALSPNGYEPASGGRLSFPIGTYNAALR